MTVPWVALSLTHKHIHGTASGECVGHSSHRPGGLFALHEEISSEAEQEFTPGEGGGKFDLSRTG